MIVSLNRKLPIAFGSAGALTVPERPAVEFACAISGEYPSKATTISMAPLRII
jgi:hypothetical protein